MIYQEWKKLTLGFFEPEELLSPDGLDLFHEGILVIDKMALMQLARFREYLATPFIVNHGNHKRRGWRSSKENLRPPCTGAPFHPMGVAFDVTTPKMDMDTFATQAKNWGFRGIGRYDTFVHIDDRPVFKPDDFFTWDFRSKPHG